MYRFTYFIRRALGNVRHNIGLNLVAAITIALALFIMGAFLLLHVNLQHLLSASSRGLTLSVYLKDGLQPESLTRLMKDVARLPGVDRSNHVTKKQALAEMRRSLGPHAGILDGLDENPLPASLELSLKPEYRDSQAVTTLIGKLRTMNGVDEVHYAWEWAERLRVFVRFVKLGALAVGALLFVAIVFIVSNTIRLTVMARREELYIMQLMGATGRFIRTPFIVEGVLQGLAGGVLAVIGLYLIFLVLSPQVSLPLGVSLVKLTFLPAYMAWLLVGVSSLLGFFGSYISLARLLRA